MNVKSVLLAGLLYTSISSGQQFNHPLRFTGGDSVFEGMRKPQVLSGLRSGHPSGPDTLRLLAIMVQFQEDTDSRTTGTGRFDFSSGTERIIDAPPHDRSYFLNHLMFLENYFRRVSDGRVEVQAEVLEQTITLSRTMSAFSPPKSGPNRALGDLLVDSWQTADSLRPDIDFSMFDVFAVFHAGVGRDIDLVSILGFDPTPLDIPSVFVGLEALKTFYGEDYRGIPVDGGSYLIDHSMILPETENRTIPSLSGDELLQLSINGLLCATLGSYLGLPDLFDTKTGRTAIGRFGLMDGQSIFSFSGLFPPEPSAWEKVYLGWVDPVVTPPGTTALTARAAGLGGSDSTVFRVPITGREYFLVENRNRDPLRNGQEVTMTVDGQTVVKTFARDTVGFNAFDVREVYGVVTDVEDYDWSLPGGVSQSGEFFDGGILIWHIDENVIEANLAANTVNADPALRGVDLEEADGSQDLGQEYGFLSPGAGSGEGTALDFWYLGNTAPVYRNEFSGTTHPSSLSNTNANSLVSIGRFSSRSPVMTFTVAVGGDEVQPLRGFPRFVGESTGNYSPQLIRNRIFGRSTSGVVAFLPDATSATMSNDGLFSDAAITFPLALVRGDPMGDLFVGVEDSSVVFWTATDGDSDGRYDSVTPVRLPIGNELTTPPVVDTLTSDVWVGGQDGLIYTIVPPSGVLFEKFSSDRINSLALVSDPSGRSVPLVATENELMLSGTGATQLPKSSSQWEVVSGTLRDGKMFFVVSDRGGSTLLAYDAMLNLLSSKEIPSTGNGLSSVAIGDVNGDALRDIVFASGTLVYAITPYGSAVDNFPVQIDGVVTGDPVIADLNGDKQLDILFTTDHQQVVAFDRKGEMLRGFPLTLGGMNRYTPAVFAEPFVRCPIAAIVVANDEGYLVGWRYIDVCGSIALPWSSFRGNVWHTGSENSPLAGSPITTEFFPEPRAYNWPNPVYDGKTNIRYYVGKDSAVRVKIFDLAGDLVEELSGPGIGGVDNEVEWDVSKIQSGIYLARIEATTGTESASTVIKIAVVK